MEKTFIAYYRVSTKKQGSSGLGLKAQEQLVKTYVEPLGTITHIYQEVESGKKSDRKELEKAINKAKETNSTLIIAKLDRLSRNASFILKLKDSNVEFICADNPQANNLTIGLLAILAQEEATRTAERTRSALQVIKQKIAKGQTHVSKSGNIVTKLGSSTGFTKSEREKSIQTRKEKALSNPESKKATAFILQIMSAETKPSFSEAARILNENGFVTPKGKSFTHTQVKRLYERIN